MLFLFRLVSMIAETVLAVPVRAVHAIASLLFFNPSLGRFRYVVAAATGYLVFAVLLVGSSLGLLLGVASTALYVVVGIAGAPVGGSVPATMRRICERALSILI